MYVILTYTSDFGKCYLILANNYKKMDLTQLFFLFIFILPSAIIHEYAHGWAAYELGDDTAERMGRLTLNPVAHIDPFSTILLPLGLFVMSGGTFLFAAAKPVPYNPYNLRNKRFGPALVALAGPVSNLIVAFVFGLFVRFLPVSSFTSILFLLVYANVLLAVFNLLPIPPLDGSKILFALMPDSWDHIKYNLERYGWYILIFLIFFVRLSWLGFIISRLTYFIVGI